MASTVAGVIGWGVSDGETVDSPATRWSTVSRADVQGGFTPLSVRGGIMPSGGSPLKVSALVTPSMNVTVNAGMCVVPGNATSIPPFGLTLLANTNLTIATAHATLPRIDLVIAHIYSDGTSGSYGQFEVITGTANASPARPTIPNTGNDHSIPLATVTVGAAVTSITAPNVNVDSTYDAGYTAGPGGVVQTRAWDDRLSGGVDVPYSQPFYSIADQLHGYIIGGNPALWGPMTRFYAGTVTTNGSGDATVYFGLNLASGFTVAAFPNALDAVTVVDLTSVGVWNQGITYKWLQASSGPGYAVFRAYKMVGGASVPMTSTAIAVSMIAVGH